MSARGAEHVLLAASTPAVTATATTAFKAYGNSLDLFITTVTGGAGTLTLALKSSFDGTTYFTCYDGDSAWAHTINVNTAGTYHDQLMYSFMPNQYYQLYYSCGVAAGTIAIKAVSWEDPSGIATFTGDIVADLDTVNTNTAAAATSLAIMDDWDESDRCKVNPIAGQAGISAGSAAIGATTPSVTLATDDPAVTLLGTIDADTSSIATDASTIAGDTTSIDGKTPALGTAAMAGSTPVTIASDDVVSTAAGIHDVAAAAKLGGFRLLGNATSALQTAVSAANDDAKINTDLSGQIRLASHTIATTSDRVEEIDPLSAQYAETSLIANEAIAADPGASYAPSSTGQAWGGYGPLSLGVYLLGGVGAAAADRTVTMTIEATNGGTVAAATIWTDITESFKSLKTGVDSAASYTSTGATAYQDILTLRREDSNFKAFRVKYDYDGDPSVTNGIVVVTARGAAI